VSTGAELPLRPGDRGDSVRDLQARLAAAGHDPSADTVGYYGEATEAAVRAFQERRGLRVDGICGPQTWSSLVEAGLALSDRLLYLRSPMLRGDDVAQLQRLLGSLGFDAGRVDGIFGPNTAAAVTEFQRNAGLPTDGICGPETVAALRRVTQRAVAEEPGTVVAHLREVEQLRTRPPQVTGLRVAVAEGGGVAALADALGRALTDAGATVAVLHQPDDSAQATAANAFEATLFVGLAVRDEPGAACAYYGHESFESAGGRRLAALVAEHLGRLGLPGDVGAPRGMRLPALRETRMPAVLVEVGPPATVVARLGELAGALLGAVSAWVTSPVEA
jgi:N-acetylmuramoyl-L-alanine amidase